MIEPKYNYQEIILALRDPDISLSAHSYIFNSRLKYLVLTDPDRIKTTPKITPEEIIFLVLERELIRTYDLDFYYDSWRYRMHQALSKLKEIFEKEGEKDKYNEMDKLAYLVDYLTFQDTTLALLNNIPHKIIVDIGKTNDGSSGAQIVSDRIPYVAKSIAEFFNYDYFFTIYKESEKKLKIRVIGKPKTAIISCPKH